MAAGDTRAVKEADEEVDTGEEGSMLVVQVWKHLFLAVPPAMSEAVVGGEAAAMPT